VGEGLGEGNGGMERGKGKRREGGREEKE